MGGSGWGGGNGGRGRMERKRGRGLCVGGAWIGLNGVQTSGEKGHGHPGGEVGDNLFGGRQGWGWEGEGAGDVGVWCRTGGGSSYNGPNSQWRKDRVILPPPVGGVDEIPS